MLFKSTWWTWHWAHDWPVSVKANLRGWQKVASQQSDDTLCVCRKNSPSDSARSIPPRHLDDRVSRLLRTAEKKFEAVRACLPQNGTFGTRVAAQNVCFFSHLHPNLTRPVRELRGLNVAGHLLALLALSTPLLALLSVDYFIIRHLLALDNRVRFIWELKKKESHNRCFQSEPRPYNVTRGIVYQHDTHHSNSYRRSSGAGSTSVEFSAGGPAASLTPNQTTQLPDSESAAASALTQAGLALRLMRMRHLLHLNNLV